MNIFTIATADKSIVVFCRCIPTWALCDGYNDCYDNSDEDACPEM